MLLIAVMMKRQVQTSRHYLFWCKAIGNFYSDYDQDHISDLEICV